MFDNDTQSRIRTVDGRLHLYADFKSNTPDSAIRFFVDSSNEVARVSPSGVGIGTTNPKQKLEVNNNTPSDTGGILVRAINYASNQDKPYLIAGTTGATSWTGATTNWGTFGFQHRFKTNSGGTPRVTIDDQHGESVSIINGGRVGIGTSAPDSRIHVYTNEASHLINIERASNQNSTIKYANADGVPVLVEV